MNNILDKILKDEKKLLFKEKVDIEFIDIVKSLRRKDFQVFILDENSTILNKSDLMNAFYYQAKFPDYFGSNWDSVEECLTDYEHLPAKGYIFIFKDPSELIKNYRKDYDLLIDVFQEASIKWNKQNIVFKLITGH